MSLFDFFRQIVRNQGLPAYLAAILNRLLIVPAFELQHVQRTQFIFAISDSCGAFCSSNMALRLGVC